MRILVLAAILALGLSIFPDTIEENDIRLSFIDFIRHYHRSYVTQGEKTERYEIFKKNYIQIFEHNLKNLPWTLKMNEFGDLSAEEFKMLYHNKKNYDQKKNQKNIFPPLKTENVEISDATGIDWTKIGLTVAPVVNQGSCGSCYAFSAVEAIQSLHYMDKGTMIIFSKQQVVDCSGKFQNEGCDGGYMQEVFEYVMEYGIERESDYKYRGYDEKCKYNKTKVAYTIDGYYNCTCNQDYDNEALIKDLTQRPISIGVDANTWQFYWGGILHHCSNGEIDHGVFLVGYGTDDSTPFWKIKNSWGSGWGEEGFIRTKRASGKDKGVCCVPCDASYPFVN